MMFMCHSMFFVFGLIFLLFCDTTLSKCNDINACSCIVPDKDAKKLTHFLDEGSPEGKVPIFYIDFCTSKLDKINEIQAICNAGKNGLLCTRNSSQIKPINVGIVEQSNVLLGLGYNNISVSVGKENFTNHANIDCCTRCGAQFAPGTNSTVILYNITLPGKLDPCKKVSTGTISVGSTLVILLFVFGGLYFIGGAIILKVLRGATGWEMLPNHEFWCDLPSLIRDGITFTFNCCRADSYERI